jgi:hypothetical protein
VLCQHRSDAADASALKPELVSTEEVTKMPEHQQRWYDQDIIIKRPLDTLERLPSNLNGTISERMCLLAENNYNANSRLKDSKQLGKDIVLALFKSKRRNRKTDTISGFYTLTNYFRVLPERHQKQIGQKTTDLLRLVLEYLRHSQLRQLPLNMGVVAQISDIFVAKGALSAMQFLNAWDTETQNVYALGEPEPLTEIEDLGLGLRLKLD